MSKKPMRGLFRDNEDTPEGKYLVKRRDGSVVEWPSFVLGARDPMAVVALRAYAKEVRRLIRDEPQQATELGLTRDFADAISNMADNWKDYRDKYGSGDPGMGRHRQDDPATIEEMRKGHSA